MKSPSVWGCGVVPTSAFTPPPAVWQPAQDSPVLACAVDSNSLRPSAATSSWERSAAPASAARSTEAGTSFAPAWGSPAAELVVAAGEHDEQDGRPHERDDRAEHDHDAPHRLACAPAGSCAHAFAGRGASRLRNSGLAA